MIKAILFDIDGVLVDSVKANARLYRDVVGHFGFRGPTDEEQAERNHYPFIDNIRFYAPSADEPLIQKIFSYGLTVPYHYERLQLMPDIKETLETVNKKYALGVVSSRLHKGIGSLLDHVGLGQFFPVRVGFEDTDKHKPDPQPLLFGVKQLGLKPAEVAYIGDSETDVQAAKAARMKMIHYDTESLPGNHQTISHFSQLPKAVASLNGS